MKKYFGNYLGLVVDDRDPENRGRTKVFIPHVMPALYESWNEEGKDIKFNITDSGLPTGLDTKIVDRLQKILPWAECAAPIFGAGPAGKYDYSTGALRADVQNVGNRRFDTLQTGGTLPVVDSAESQARAAAAIQNGLIGGQGMCARGANNILSNYVFGKDMATAGANYARQMGPIIESRYSMSQVQDTGVYQNGDTRLLTKDSNPSDAGHMETYMNGVWYSDHQQSASLEGRGYTSIGLWRLPGGTAGVANAANTGTVDIANANAPEVNPSIDPPAKQDANTKPDLTAETGTVQDKGTSNVSYDKWRSLPVLNSRRMNARSNNPGNLHTISTPYAGQISSAADIAPAGKYGPGQVNTGDVAYFDTLENGIAQNINQINLNINKYGTNTITTMARRWVGGSEANVQYAINVWSQGSGISPDEILNINNQAQIKALLAGISLNEGGGIPENYNKAFDAGYNIWQKRSGSSTEQDILQEQSAVTPNVASAASQPTIPNPTPAASVGGPNTNYMPTGMFGSARAGQTVWVFFQEGNPLFPVYFAASYGANEWANITQASSPDPIKNEKDPLQGVQTTLSLDAGGIASKQIISGQESGFEKDDFAFQVFGKNGSALTFTFLATLLNSKYDFKQHTQGDAHYITGGNRTDRTTGDHNIVCEQDLIITVGNWSQEALDAANEIQGVINEAMKAAKDTYESSGGGSTGGNASQLAYDRDARNTTNVIQDENAFRIDTSTLPTTPQGGQGTLGSSDLNNQPSTGISSMSINNTQSNVQQVRTGNAFAINPATTESVFTIKP